MPSFFGVLNQEPRNTLHTVLAGLLLRLKNGTSAKDISVDFFPALSKAVKGSKTFNPMQQDDVHAFWCWLFDEQLPWIGEELFTATKRSTIVFDGIELSPRDEREVGFVVSLLSAPHLKIHQLIEQGESIDDFALNTDEVRAARQKQFPELVWNDEVDNARYSGKVQVDRVFKVIDAPPVLVINAVKFAYDYERGTQRWRNDIPTLYDDSFELGGRRYRLHARIVHVGNHYMADVCTDVSEDVWYRFSDDQVTLTSRHNALQGTGASKFGDPYLFFYVRDDLLEEWSAFDWKNDLKMLEQHEITAHLGDMLEVTRDTVDHLVGKIRGHRK